jgi:hypothetical protein
MDTGNSAINTARFRGKLNEIVALMKKQPAMSFLPFSLQQAH